MNTASRDVASLDSAFHEAVASIDTGDEATLQRLITANPELVRRRLESPGAWLREKVNGALDGFFKQPYLLWFVAEDPVRNGTLPGNIATIAGIIIDAARRESPSNFQEQVDYALTLVSWSWIARQNDVQIQLIDVLIDAGAAVDGNPDNALVNRNIDAANHLVERGAALTLATALCLERWDDADRLLATANDDQKRFSFVLAALTGNAGALQRMIRAGIDINATSAELYPHGTPLHHAVSSGSLGAVQVLVEAGANPGIRDTAWEGTPLGWAEYYSNDTRDAATEKQYARIVEYLRNRARPSP